MPSLPDSHGHFGVFGGGYAAPTGFGGQTTLTDTAIAARVIAGLRIATEFIPRPVPAGTDAGPRAHRAWPVDS